MNRDKYVNMLFSLELIFNESQIRNSAPRPESEDNACPFLEKRSSLPTSDAESLQHLLADGPARKCGRMSAASSLPPGNGV